MIAGYAGNFVLLLVFSMIKGFGSSPMLGTLNRMVILLSDTDPAAVNFEFDSYWFAEGGADPLTCMKRLGERMKLWHINDRGARLSGPAMTPILNTDSAELGIGDLPLEALTEQAKCVSIKTVVLESHRNWIHKSPVRSFQVSTKFLNERF